MVRTCNMCILYNVYNMSCAVCMVGYSVYSRVKYVEYPMQSKVCAVKLLVCKKQIVYYSMYRIACEVQ